ncbi:NADH:ubiquinone oxidoreductase subunit J [Alicyclobacillus contaminans]|uniref:NADH-quinone oxidoreductase subunit J n=1 Tax=Alicyclobacillus contaminans TaxID=392016 RepID=UPI0003FE6563|nr:NADH-quinone oxidoreductase subunit J [Alicyclobacillus contaminans]GMA50944.1 NADH:ubiquinone oxidoreductase subunit J [Alicyclobacillus contaminans]
MSGPLIAFYVIALCVLSCAVLLLSARRVIHMALSVGGVFIGCAALYLLLDAEFVGVAQILIYAGAITILILFAIMLTNHEAQEPPFRWNVRNVLSALGCLLLCAVILLSIRRTAWPVPDASVDINGGNSNPVAIGMALFKQYAIPFELVSLLLIVALVGAVLLARSRKEDE